MNDSRLNIANDLKRNDFLLVVMNESKYTDMTTGLTDIIKKTKGRICYLCLSRPYRNVIDDLKKKEISTARMFFVDVLSSHYEKLKSKRCAFIDSPSDLDAIRKAVKGFVKNHDCNVLLFDNISGMLMYQEGFYILKFTNKMAAENKDTKKVFFALKDCDIIQKENKQLIKDLGLFADKTIFVN